MTRPAASVDPLHDVVAVSVVAGHDAVELAVIRLLQSGRFTATDPAEAQVLIFGCAAFRAEEGDRVRELNRRYSPAPVLIVSRPQEATRVRQALAAGASGFVTDADGLPSAVLAVLSGQLCLPEAYRRQLERPTFTTREKQILGLVVMGLSNGEIGRKLFLAESTVKSHLSSAFGKLGVRSRNEATAMILDPESGLGPGILRISEDLPGTRRLAVQ